MTPTDLDTIDIFDPDQYVEGPPHEVFEYLRREQPVFRQDMPDGTALLGGAASTPTSSTWPASPCCSRRRRAAWSSRSSRRRTSPRCATCSWPWTRPATLDYRKPLARRVQGQGHRPHRGPDPGDLPRHHGRGREQGDVEFVHDVAVAAADPGGGPAHGPARRGPGRRSTQWAEQNTSGQDPEINPEAASGLRQPGGAAARSTWRCTPSASRPAPAGPSPSRGPHLARSSAATSAGSPMTDLDFGSFFVQLVTAGNDTTKTMLSSGLLALLQHPDQLAELRADPSLIPGAVEEILRWANPLHYFRRTATADTDASAACRLRPATRWRCSTRRPTATTRCSPTRTASTSTAARIPTSRSASPSTSVSACTSPGSKGRVFFEELLRAFAAIERRPSRAARAPTSTTP